MSDTNHECKSRTTKIVTNILSTTFVVDTKYKKCWQQYVADSNVNAPLLLLTETSALRQKVDEKCRKEKSEQKH